MITVEYCRLMARYNRWQNQSLMDAASTLTDQERRQDRGAFFGSIAATFHHLVWDDTYWLARFSGDTRPEDRIDAGSDRPVGWTTFCALRRQRDDDVADWALNLDESDLAGTVAWYPGGSDQRVKKPYALCAVHLFNHQTHHRGQIHALLTSAGAKPEATDLPMLKETS